MTLRTITFDDTEWQVVPKRPTMKQVTVGAEHSSSDDHMIARGQAVAIYDDMLAAAPEPETCFCDEKGIGDPEKSCGDCPRDYGMPTVRANPEPPMALGTQTLQGVEMTTKHIPFDLGRALAGAALADGEAKHGK